MVFFEGIHSMKRGRFDNGDYAALKIDMDKAYDWVEWPFLEAMMLKLGFDERWVEKIRRCVSSVRYSFNINGSVRGAWYRKGVLSFDKVTFSLLSFSSFAPKDSLASFEIQKKQGRSAGLDSVLMTFTFPTCSSRTIASFSSGQTKECEAVATCLSSYAAASRQLINYTKSNIFFGMVVSEDTKDTIAARIGVGSTPCHQRYLGLPTLTRRRKKDLFAFV